LLVLPVNTLFRYAQCELMSAHYKHPILLIEWEEQKSFSLGAISDTKSQYAKAKHSMKKSQESQETQNTVASPDIQSKLVLLSLNFPQVRIIWSSSPYATAEIFKDLKSGNYEPNILKAIAMGIEEDTDITAAINGNAEDLLRALPGISSKEVKNIMKKIESIKQLCCLSLLQMQEILGVESGKLCWEFIHAV
jgi:DNA excision repair protein ERCC-4